MRQGMQTIGKAGEQALQNGFGGTMANGGGGAYNNNKPKEENKTMAMAGTGIING